MQFSRNLLLSSAALLFVVFFFAAQFARGQAETATISGQVVDATGAIVRDASVELRSVQQGTSATALTNSAGIYVFPSIQPGQYSVTVRKQGFKQVDLVGVVANVQDHIEQNFKLQVGSTSESITVSGEGININTTDGTVSTVVDRQFVESMPLNGRSMQSLITLAPGVLVTPPPYGGPGDSGTFSVNGQRTDSNYFTVDGVSANSGSGPDGLYGAGGVGGSAHETALGTTQSLVALDALQEFRVDTSSYSAEFGHGAGAQVTLVSRSGSNKWSGTLFDYFRNTVLDASNWFNGYTNSPPIPKSAEHQNDFGGTFGGPVTVPHLYDGRDRTFFFFSYEGLRLVQPQGAFMTQVPDLNLRAATPQGEQPMINAFPIPNGAEVTQPDANGVQQPTGLAFFTAAYSNPGSLDATSVRIDHHLSNNMTLFGRYSDTPSKSVSRDTYDALSEVDNLFGASHTLTLGFDDAISAQLSEQARFSVNWSNLGYSATSDNFGGAEPVTIGEVFNRALPIDSQFFWAPCFANCPSMDLAYFDNPQHQWNFVDSVSLWKGNHSFKFGVDYRRTLTKNDANEFEPEYLYFSEQSILNNAADAVYVNDDNSLHQAPLAQNFGVYAQDEWKISPALSLSFGLRWDLNPPIKNSNGPQPIVLDQLSDLSTTKPVASGTPIYHTDYEGFGPRLGVAYRLRSTPGRETVVRAGGGLFFDSGQQTNGIAFVYQGYRSSAQYSNLVFPLPAADYAVPAPSFDPPFSNTVVGFQSHMKLPFSGQWNFAIEQALGASRSLSIGYIGTVGRDLIDEREFAGRDLSNPLFLPSSNLLTYGNMASSDYHSLQAQFKQSLNHGLQVLASYTWSHAIDDNSSPFFRAGLEPLLRGNSDYDVRQNLQTALTYAPPGFDSNPLLATLTSHWGIDTRIVAQSAPPVDVNLGQSYVNGVSQYLRPAMVPGEPAYVYGSQYPGGMAFNYKAFNGTGVIEGNEPRNFLRAFGVAQADVALRRQFPLTERLTLNFRAEAFNLLNHPNFGDMQNNLSSGPVAFGLSQATLNNSLGDLNALYQIGGPRSLQLMLKLQF